MSADMIEPELLQRAMHPKLVFGRKVIAEHSREWMNALLITMPEVYEHARPLLAAEPGHLHFVESMDGETVEHAQAELPEADTVVGIGGGMALDMAKYVAYKRERQPVLAPSIASVDACVTNTVAIRDQGRVRYVGFVVPEAVLADFSLMQKAHPRLNRAGIGDILSIHTGSFDWKLAASRGKDDYDEKTATSADYLVENLESRTEEIRKVSDHALKWLIEAYAEENRLCLEVGHSRPEEGSEHYFCYNLEYRTGRGFVHGELVCLGVHIMSRLQENDPGRVDRILEQAGVNFHPRQLGISRQEIFQALRTLPDYVNSEGLPYSIINDRGLEEHVINEITRDLEF
ncbi:MAG: iron-containing alcohol dehydrogenase [bacterium]